MCSDVMAIAGSRQASSRSSRASPSRRWLVLLRAADADVKKDRWRRTVFNPTIVGGRGELSRPPRAQPSRPGHVAPAMPLRRLLLCSVAVASLAACPAATAAAPSGFTAPRIVGAGLDVTGVIAAADAPDGATGAVAFATRSGDVWAARVRSDGTPGSPLPVAEHERDLRDVRIAIDERGEIVVVWPAIVDRSGRSAVRYAVAAPGRGFSGVHTIASVGSNTGATPQLAALRDGSVAVVFRDTHPPQASGVLRYARRPPGRAFGAARSLGHDGVRPDIAPTPGGGAVLSWARGPLSRRVLQVAVVRRGASLPGRAATVAGHVRVAELSASADGTAWVTWTRRTTAGPTTGFARRVRPSVGPVQSLGTVAYGSPHIAFATSKQVLAAWNAQGPGVTANVQLAAALGSGGSLGAPVTLDAGGFAQTSPIPAFLRSTPLVLFTRQIPSTSGAPSEAVAADPTSGESTVLGPAGNIGAPAVAHIGDALLVAWAAQGGGAAVSAAR
jgi:hypothetical protein